ncbi:MAG: hypothetical protein IJH32_07905 [Ruminococcus sp.]|nr:hypothetical protein [Ruminococcus sp.]
MDYTGSGLRPTEQLSNTQIPMTVGYEFLQFTSPDDNTWFDDPLEYSIEHGDRYPCYGNSCYLDYAGVDSEAYDLYDCSGLLMKERSYYSFTSDAKPITIQFYLTAEKNYIFKTSSYVQINGKKADLQIINGKHAIASVQLTYNDSDKVVDNIALKGSFVPTAGQSATIYTDTLNNYIDCDDGKCEVVSSLIGESGRYDTPYTGTLEAGNTYYMWFEVKNYSPYLYGVDLTYSFYDSTGKSNPSSYSKNYGSLMGEAGAVWVSVPFIVPAQSAGCMIRGTVTSFLDSSNNVFLQLLQGDSVKKNTNVTGNTASYSITNVPAGTYTLRVSKKNHVDRDYTVVISGEMIQNVTINPLGDVTLDGKVNIRDVNNLYNHVKGSVIITDTYSLQCGDVYSPGKGVNIRDVNTLYNHVKGNATLY